MCVKRHEGGSEHHVAHMHCPVGLATVVQGWTRCVACFYPAVTVCLLQVAAGYVLHVGRAARGELRVGDDVKAAVDLPRRARIVPNHTFTHVLNFALREVCCLPRGSLVNRIGIQVLQIFSIHVRRGVAALSLLRVHYFNRSPALSLHCKMCGSTLTLD